MPAAPTLLTPRLVLRPWRDDDLAPFAEMNADPRVMEYFPKTLSRDESDAALRRNVEHFARHGYGKWVVEVAGGAPFAGYVGLAIADFPAPFTPAVEIGWRLAAEHWGRGYATEAAAAVLGHAFDRLALAEVVSFTVPSNRRSRAVMERLGMTRDGTDDFDHSSLPKGHPLRRHVLYRMSRAAWGRVATATGKDNAHPIPSSREER